MAQCERNSKRTGRVSEEAETMDYSSSVSPVSKRLRLIGLGLGDTELPDSAGHELQETASSSPVSLPPAADEQEGVATLNSGAAAGVSSLEESSSRCCSSNDSGELVDLEGARSFETEGSTSCVDNHHLSRERRSIGSSSELSSSSTDEEMESKPEKGERRARGRVEPLPPARSVKIQMPSQAELDDFFGGFEREACKGFTEKYNFDFVKEVPLEGRYEWVRMKPGS